MNSLARAQIIIMQDHDAAGMALPATPAINIDEGPSIASLVYQWASFTLGATLLTYLVLCLLLYRMGVLADYFGTPHRMLRTKRPPIGLAGLFCLLASIATTRFVDFLKFGTGEYLAPTLFLLLSTIIGLGNVFLVVSHTTPLACFRRKAEF